MLRVGDMQRSIDFYTRVLGMKLLRTTDRPEQKYSLAFVGYDSEDKAAVLELTYNYGFDLETWEDHPCRCGKPSCVGYILDKKYWKKLGRILDKKAEKEKKIQALEQRAKELEKQLNEPAAKPKKPAKKTTRKKVRK